ncbi:MAG: iron hydrogenase small subunit, partial [Firmicutes bacterium]|nr:iron hydrogenase small subunit [Bacillota bacterium]
ILKKKVENLDFKDVRGEQGIKVADIELGGIKVKAAVVSGIKNAERVLQDVKSGKEKYHFIEVMACPGGCANGSGMPIMQNDAQAIGVDTRKRAETLYHMDQYCELRRSHTNPTVLKIYDEYLGGPNSKKAHQLFHTTYKKRKSLS